MATLLGLLAEMGDQVIPVLRLLQAAECHLGSGNVLLWVLEVLKLDDVSLDARSPHEQLRLTRVSSFHVIAFCLLASVYEKPSTEPVLRPKRP